VLRTDEVPALIVTTSRGAERVHDRVVTASVKIATVAEGGTASAEAILDAIGGVRV
jgi:hypothetical protein